MCRVAPRELVRDAVERVVLSGHEGKSGAGLERVRLATDATLVVKRFEPRHRPHPRGHRRRCPAGSTFCGDPAPSTVCRDVGHADRGRLGRGRHHRRGDARSRRRGAHLGAAPGRPTSAAWVMARVAGPAPGVPGRPARRRWCLSTGCSGSSPRRRRPGGATEDASSWRRWRCGAGRCSTECVPRPTSPTPCSALLEDVGPLATGAARRGRCTLAHGDLATVNMAFEGDDAGAARLGDADGRRPGAARRGPLRRRVLLGRGRESRGAARRRTARAAGPAYDERAMRLALLVGPHLARLEQGARRRRSTPTRQIRVTGEGGPRLVGRATHATTLESGAL